MPRKRVIVLTIVFLLITGLGCWVLSFKQWSGKQLESQRVTDTVELVVAEFNHADYETVEITAVRFHPLNNPPEILFTGLEQDSEPSDFIAIADRQEAVAMINGGYFDASFQPVGLVVSEGQVLSEISKQPALSGVLAVFKDRSLKLIPRSAYLPDDAIDSAIQAGPFIIDPGGKPGIKSDDLKKATRTAIGQTARGDLVFISTTPCTLFELSEILSHHAETLGVDQFDRVLNLDGGPSTGLYLWRLEEQHVVPKTAVPNTILIRLRWR